MDLNLGFQAQFNFPIDLVHQNSSLEWQLLSPNLVSFIKSLEHHLQMEKGQAQILNLIRFLCVQLAIKLYLGFRWYFSSHFIIALHFQCPEMGFDVLSFRQISERN